MSLRGTKQPRTIQSGHASSLCTVRDCFFTAQAVHRNDINYYFSRMKIHLYYVYILTNKSNRVLYVGVTSDLQNRVSEHKLKIHKGFTAKYECNKLVYYEEYQWIQDAIAREKQLKAGSRQNKIVNYS